MPTKKTVAEMEQEKLADMQSQMDRLQREMRAIRKKTFPRPSEKLQREPLPRPPARNFLPYIPDYDEAERYYSNVKKRCGYGACTFEGYVVPGFGLRKDKRNGNITPQSHCTRCRTEQSNSYRKTK